ncbi:MAG TPA: GNAT family N-acetyltransferase [Catenuloplanes sp.]|jgi:GNAT superfamily N-acetyltransferase
MLEKRLYHHLVSWLGQWPTRRQWWVVGSDRRVTPGWDGRVHPLIGVGQPGATVLSVPASRISPVRTLLDLPASDLLEKLPATLGVDGRRTFQGVFRYCTAPLDLPDAGQWLPADDPGLPGWLRPFGGEVLVARDPDTGGYLAGVGIKQHDRYGRELAVGTDPAARGRGLGRRLVAQAARRVLDEGGIPTYVHADDNKASARVADAAGFPDRGWTFYGLAEE